VVGLLVVHWIFLKNWSELLTADHEDKLAYRCSELGALDKLWSRSARTCFGDLSGVFLCAAALCCLAKEGGEHGLL